MPSHLIWALVCAIAPFFLSIGGSSSTSINGVVVECSSFNLLGIIGGAVAMFLAVKLVRQTEPEIESHYKFFGFLAGGLGLIQLLIGFGLAGGACG